MVHMLLQTRRFRQVATTEYLTISLALLLRPWNSCTCRLKAQPVVLRKTFPRYSSVGVFKMVQIARKALTT